MNLLAMVGLDQVMRRTEGDAGVVVGLVDGPVAIDHPDLAGSRIASLADRPAVCRSHRALACLHGTFIAGMLSARRGSDAPAICPGCTLLVHPVFSDLGAVPAATPGELATAIHRCIDAGVTILNISSALWEPSLTGQAELTRALDRAAHRGVLVVAAAGNAATVGATALTGHPWVVPVVGYDERRLPMERSTFGRSIGNRGLGAPGRQVTSLAAGGGVTTLDGTSFAAPFVTGAAALLLSTFPTLPVARVKQVLCGVARRPSIVPPLLDAEQSFRALEGSVSRVRRPVHAP